MLFGTVSHFLDNIAKECKRAPVLFCFCFVISQVLLACTVLQLVFVLLQSPLMWLFYKALPYRGACEGLWREFRATSQADKVEKPDKPKDKPDKDCSIEATEPACKPCNYWINLILLGWQKPGKNEKAAGFAFFGQTCLYMPLVCFGDFVECTWQLASLAVARPKAKKPKDGKGKAEKGLHGFGSAALWNVQTNCCRCN